MVTPHLLPFPKDILASQRLNFKPFFLMVPNNKIIQNIAMTCDSIFPKMVVSH